MLVDAYFLDKEYDKAVECIDNFMLAVEKDAALLTLKSMMLNAKGDANDGRTGNQWSSPKRTNGGEQLGHEGGSRHELHPIKRIGASRCCLDIDSGNAV